MSISAYTDFFAPVTFEPVSALSGAVVDSTTETDDLPADTTTTGTLLIDSPAYGIVTHGRDEDWYRLDVSGGYHYVLTLEGHTDDSAELRDPYLYLYDSSGSRMRQNDDRNHLDSQITFYSAVDATLFAGAGSYGSNTGAYVLEVTALTTYGTTGDDEIDGTERGDLILGRDGDDTISGLQGADKINGNEGNDLIRGNNGNDTIRGGVGADTIHAGEGHDIVYGDAGADYVTMGSGNDQFFDNSDLSGANGRDTVYGGGGYDSIYGSAGNDEFHGGDLSDHIEGGEGNDRIFGDEGADRIEGGSGDDVIFGGAGYDTIYGDLGNDTVRGGGGRDLVWLGDGDDIFHDGTQSGRHAHDTVYGGAGNDTIFAGGGNDRLTGGDDADVFAFVDNCGLDTITDFEDGIDLIDLSAWSDVTSFDDLTLDIQFDGVTIYRAASLLNQVFVNDADVNTLDDSDFIFAIA